VRTTERRQLKSDRFAETAVETFSWANEHRNTVIWGGLALAIIAAVYFGVTTYISNQGDRANSELAAAMSTYNASLGAANPAQPAEPTFPTATERAKAAHQKFEQVADQYGHTDAGKVARYMGGVTAEQMGDNAMAERELKRAVDNGGSDVAALARMALAGVYRSTNRDQQAIDLYKYVIDHPTNSVGKTAAQLELASLYEAKNPQEAIKIYQDIQKDKANLQSPAGQQAATRLASLKPQ
jgi:tetratricopeptide (TPR) repeat protein